MICLPLLAKRKPDLLAQAVEIVAMRPDMLEWRVDGYENVADIDDCLVVVKELRSIVGELPVIFTCRSHLEEGLVDLPQKQRLQLLQAVIGSGNVDIVDVEISNEEDFLSKIVKEVRSLGVKLILSYHNFATTPDETFLIDKLIEGQNLGGDISKLAVMPKNYSDVLTLLSATEKARSGRVDVPIVTMAMGDEGKITRLAGGLFGSDITFAVGTESSAPGQIPISEMRAAMKVIF